MLYFRDIYLKLYKDHSIISLFSPTISVSIRRFRRLRFRSSYFVLLSSLFHLFYDYMFIFSFRSSISFSIFLSIMLKYLAHFSTWLYLLCYLFYYVYCIYGWSIFLKYYCSSLIPYYSSIIASKMLVKIFTNELRRVIPLGFSFLLFLNIEIVTFILLLSETTYLANNIWNDFVSSTVCCVFPSCNIRC